MMVRGFQPEDEVSWAVQETPLSLSGNTAPGQAVLDFIADVTTSTGIDNNCKLSISPSPVSGQYTASNLTPSVCSMDASGNVTRQQDGICSVEIASPGSKKMFTRSMLRSGGGTIYNVTGWAPGSLSKHISDQIDAMIAGKNPGSGAQWLFNGATYSTAAPAGTRNSGIVSGAVDLSPFSFARSDLSVAEYPVTLISSHHFVCAAHVAPAYGRKITFLDNNNVFHTATMVQGTLAAGDPDIYVGYLTWDGGGISGITPVSFFPDTWRSAFPNLANANNFGQVSNPALVQLYDDATGQRKLHVAKWLRLPAMYPDGINYTNDGYQTPESYAPWSGLIQGGDSSSPIFVPVNDGTLKTVLLCSLWTATSSPSYSGSNNLSAITAAMRTTAQWAGDAGYTSYAAQTVTLAGFTAY